MAKRKGEQAQQTVGSVPLSDLFWDGEEVIALLDQCMEYCEYRLRASDMNEAQRYHYFRGCEEIFNFMEQRLFKGGGWQELGRFNARRARFLEATRAARPLKKKEK